MLTALICFFVGGVMSEFIQSMLPVRLSYGLHFRVAPYKNAVQGIPVWRHRSTSRVSHLNLSSFDCVMKANLLGSSIGLYTAYYLERYYRQRREVSYSS